MKNYLAETLHDLEDGIDNEAVSHMFDCWRYDEAKLRKRGHYFNFWWGEHPARPRIDIRMHITARDNLVVEWTPTGVNTPDCDWREWWAIKHRHQGFDSRPSNELLLIRELGMAVRHLGRKVDPIHTAEDKVIEGILLQATNRLVADLKHRLDYNFEVRLVNDIFTERVGERYTKWEIDNVEERTKRHEREELEGSANKYGFPLEELAQALIAGGVPKKPGAAEVSADRRDQRASTELKKAGHKEMTLGDGRALPSPC